MAADIVLAVLVAAALFVAWSAQPPAGPPGAPLL